MLPLLCTHPPPRPAGKSTYLKQAGLLTVMAHVGCFVPAQFAAIRLTDRVCTRLGTGDDMAANASTFLKEVRTGGGGRKGRGGAVAAPRT